MSKEKAIALLRDARKHREHARKLELLAKRQLEDERRDDHEAHGEHEVRASEVDHFSEAVYHSLMHQLSNHQADLHKRIHPQLKGTPSGDINKGMIRILQTDANRHQRHAEHHAAKCGEHPHTVHKVAKGVLDASFPERHKATHPSQIGKLIKKVENGHKRMRGA